MFIFFSIALILIGIVLLNFKCFGQIELILSCVSLRCGAAVAAVNFLPWRALTIFPQLRCKPSVTSPKVHDAKIRHADCGSRMFCNFFRSGAKKNRPSGRTLLQCYGVTVPKIVAMGGVKYLYIYILYRYRIIFEVW